MNVPVKVNLKNFEGKVQTVLDDELHNLINQGLVSYHDALSALKNAGLALDKRFYPWLRDVENAATGEFNSANAPKQPESKPDLLVEKPAPSKTAPAKANNLEGAK